MAGMVRLTDFFLSRLLSQMTLVRATLLVNLGYHLAGLPYGIAASALQGGPLFQFQVGEE